MTSADSEYIRAVEEAISLELPVKASLVSEKIWSVAFKEVPTFEEDPTPDCDWLPGLDIIMEISLEVIILNSPLLKPPAPTLVEAKFSEEIPIADDTNEGA